jgi:hypothetical protein
MAEKNIDITGGYPELANYLSTVPMCHKLDEKLEFVVISYEPKSGNIQQLAFRQQDAEHLLGGLIESLASQRNPMGLVLYEYIVEFTEASDEEDEDEEGDEADYVPEEYQGEDDEDDEDIDLDATNTSGDDFGPDA